jgi:exosortase K
VKGKVLVLTVAVLAMWGLKRYYADAGADDLHWILAPTASVVSVGTGTAFIVVPGEGYMSRQRRFLIEKSCAGINFMIAAFGMMMFTLRARIRSCLSGIGLLATTLVASYAAAVIVNAARIAIAIWLAAQPLAPSMPAAAQLHRMEGIAVYFSGLVALYELVMRFDRGQVMASHRPRTTP